MVSILIPTFNYDCSPLIRDLQRQAAELAAELGSAFRYEILVFDDGSSVEERERLQNGVEALPHCRVISTDKNVGQAKGRNILIGMAKYDWCLLIDSDAVVCSEDFLSQYWDARNEADVVCGALRNPVLETYKGHELRYKYEKAAEGRRTAEYRNRHPYEQFTAFNAMFRKRVFSTVCFDEKCTEYGYEDALMGLQLKAHGFTILHTDNALIHSGIDTNDSFLCKTEAALRTLSRLGETMQKAAGPSRLYHKLRKWHLAAVVSSCFGALRPLLRANLLSPHPSLFLFKWYKLGYYSLLQSEKMAKKHKIV